MHRVEVIRQPDVQVTGVQMKLANTVALVLVIVGAINSGLVATAD